MLWGWGGGWGVGVVVVVLGVGAGYGDHTWPMDYVAKVVPNPRLSRRNSGKSVIMTVPGKPSHIYVNPELLEHGITCYVAPWLE